MPCSEVLLSQNTTPARQYVLQDRFRFIVAILLFRVTNQGFKSVGDLLGVPGMTKEKFKKIVDLCTVAGNVQQIPGLININTAPKKVLLAIPEMTEEMAGKIIGQRTQEDLDLSNIGWLVDVLSNEEIRKIANFLTTRSYQFRFDSVGVVAPEEGVEIKSTPFRRFMAVYDKLKEPPGLVYWKDWSKFGLPYDVNEVNE